MGDFYPNLLCLRRGLYQPSIQVKMAMRAWAKDFQLRRSMSSHSKPVKKLSAMALLYDFRRARTQQQ